MRQVATAGNKNKCTTILINQVRDNIGSYGGGEVTPGGKAAPFYSSIRLRIAKRDILKKGSKEIGVVISAKGVKNKVGTPFREREMTVFFPHEDARTGKIIAGIDTVSDLVTVAIELEAIKAGGAWITFSYQGKEYKYNGKVKLATAASEDPALLTILQALVATAKTKGMTALEQTSEAEIEEATPTFTPEVDTLLEAMTN